MTSWTLLLFNFFFCNYKLFLFFQEFSGYRKVIKQVIFKFSVSIFFFFHREIEKTLVSLLLFTRSCWWREKIKNVKQKYHNGVEIGDTNKTGWNQWNSNSAPGMVQFYLYVSPILWSPQRVCLFFIDNNRDSLARPSSDLGTTRPLNSSSLYQKIHFSSRVQFLYTYLYLFLYLNAEKK